MTTPDNGAYMHVAYAAIAVLYAGYAFLLARRRARVRGELRRRGGSGAGADRMGANGGD